MPARPRALVWPPARGRNDDLGTLDGLMIALAFFSAFLAILDWLDRPRFVFGYVPGPSWTLPGQNWAASPAIFLRPPFYGLSPFAWLLLLDLLVCIAFLVHFVVAGENGPGVGPYARHNWWDLVGMVPLGLFVVVDWGIFGCASWAAIASCPGPNVYGLDDVAFLWHLGIVVVAAARITWIGEWILGERVIRRFARRYEEAIVAEIGDAVLLRALDTTEAILTSGHYTQSLGTAIDRKRPEIDALVRKNLEAHRTTAILAQPEFVQDAIRKAEQGVIDSVVLTLTSAELDRIVRDTIHVMLKDFKSEIAKGRWVEKALEEHGGTASRSASAAGTGARHRGSGGLPGP
jgi:hypothetical protein